VSEESLLDECHAAVRAALRGEPIPLQPSDTKMLWYMLHGEAGSDAAITRSSLVAWYGRGGTRYDLRVAPGVLGFLLGGAVVAEGRHVIRRIDGASVPRLSGFPAFGVRYVRVDTTPEQTLIRVRTSEAPLAELGPDVPIEGRHCFVVLDRACPHCGRVPERYRVLTSGAYVCLACGASMPPP